MIDEKKLNNDEYVNHPAHYRKESGIEVIDVIYAWNLDFALGNALKYIARCGIKNADTEIQDIEKAIWYLNFKLKNLKNLK